MVMVRDVLEQKGRQVYGTHPDASVRDAVKIMAERNVGALVVLEADELVGLITERDYARNIVLKGRTSATTTVREIMARKVYIAHPDQTVQQCMAVMTARAVRHLPVVEDGRLVGIVSIGDMVKHVIADQQFTIEQLEHYIQGTR